MKNKVLWGMTGLVLLLVFLMAGCGEAGVENPSDFKNANTEFKGIYTLSAPKTVTASAYGPTGFIRVAWDPVDNAIGYVVYRKSEDPNGLTTVVYKGDFSGAYASGTDLFLDDEISYSNEFKAGVQYTYKVIAFSAWSSNPNGDGFDWNHSTVEDWVVLQNSSKDSNTVTFSGSGSNALPAASSKLPTPQNLNLTRGTLYPTTGFGSITEIVQATWTAVPGVRYIVRYSIANGLTGNYPMQFQTVVNVSDNQTTAACRIPLIFGSTYVEVVASQKTPATAPDPYYYFDSDPVSKTLELTRAMLPAVTGFGAALTTNTTTDFVDGYVTLTWTKAPEAASYKVYRLVGSQNNFAANTYVIQNWTDITAAINIHENVVNGGFETQMQGIDSTLSDLPAGAALYYMVIASNSAGIMSYPAVVTATTAVIANPAFTADNLGWDAVTSTYSGIHVYWTSNTSYNYKLYRGVLEQDPNTGALVQPTTYEQITEGITLEDGHRYGLTDTPALRKSYQYKLEIYRGSTLLETDFARVTSVPYTNTLPLFNLTINNTPLITRPAASPEPRGDVRAYEIGFRLTSGYTLAQLSKLMNDNEMVIISRIATNANGSTFGNDYTQVTTIPKNNLNANLEYLYGANAAYNGREYVDQLSPGYFGYKIQIVDEFGRVSANNTGSVNNGTGGTFISSSNPTGLTLNANTSGDNVTFRVTGANAGTARLERTQLIVRYATGGSVVEAQTKYNQGFYETRELILYRLSNPNDYESGSITVSNTLSCYAVVTYKEGTYLSGTGTNAATFYW
jgi:hypothetical protein